MENTQRNRQPQGTPVGGQFAANPRGSAGVSLNGPIDLNLPIDEDFAQNFLEEYDLDHGNGEVHVQDGRFLVSVEGAGHTTTLVEVPEGSSRGDFYKEFVTHARGFDADDEFDSLTAHGAADSLKYIRNGHAEVKEAATNLPTGNEVLDREGLEDLINNHHLNDGPNGGVWEDSGGYLVEMNGPTGLIIRAHVEVGSTTSQARDKLIEAADEYDVEDHFLDTYSYGIRDIAPLELHAALESDGDYFREVADKLTEQHPELAQAPPHTSGV